MKLASLESFLKSREKFPIYSKKFKYTGNIRHIKAFIDKNKPNRECIVEIWVRKPSKIEEEIYEFTRKMAKAPKAIECTKSKSNKTNSRTTNRVERKARVIP